MPLVGEPNNSWYLDVAPLDGALGAYLYDTIKMIDIADLLSLQLNVVWRKLFVLRG